MTITVGSRTGSLGTFDYEPSKVPPPMANCTECRARGGVCGTLNGKFISRFQ